MRTVRTTVRTTGRTLRRLAPIAAWLVGLGAVLAVLHGAGDGALAGPDLRRPGTWGSWAGARTPAEAVIAVLRLAGLALVAYLLVVTPVVCVVQLGRWPRAVTVVDVLALPVVRAAVQATLGIGLAGATAAAVSAASSRPAPVPTAADMSMIVAVGDEGTGALRADEAPPVLRRLDDVSPTPPRQWTVAAGDHLWSIAERVLAEAWARQPTDADVVAYWEEVVARNRDRLADADNPDLIFPGQVLLVPDPPSAI